MTAWQPWSMVRVCTISASACSSFMARSGAWRPRSLWLDAGEPDHLAPFFCFVGDELAERGGRSRQWHVSEVGETGVQLGIDKPGVDRCVQHLDNLSRGVAGRADPIERGGLIARQR